MKKKQLKTTYYDVLIIPEHESTSKTFKLKKIWIRLVLIFTFISLATIAFLIFDNKDIIAKAGRYDLIVQENLDLKKENLRVRSLWSELEKLKSFRERTIKSLANSSQLGDLSKFSSVPDSIISEISRATEDEEKFFNAYEVMNETVPSISPVENPIISKRYEYSSNQKSGHLGIDLVSKEGSMIKAAAAGIVIFSDWTVNYGNTIIVKHAHNYMTIYKHNKSNTVVSGQKVKKSDIIAYLGGTGKITTGAHLHFEVWHNSRPVDPETVVFDFK